MLCGRAESANTAGTKMRVAMVAAQRPPMTARPSGAFCSPPSPSAERHGDHADDHGESGHERRDGSGLRRLRSPSESVAGFLQALFGEGDDKDGVRRSDTHAHDGSHQRGTESVVRVRNRKSTMPADGRGKRRDDDEGIEPGLEVDDDQQVDEQDGEREAEEQADVGAVHRLDLAAHVDEVACA